MGCRSNRPSLVSWCKSPRAIKSRRSESSVGPRPGVSAQRLERVVAHRTAEAGDAAQERLPGGREAVVGRFQHVMLALDQIAAHVQPLRGGDVAGLLEVAHDQAGQQAQAERMVAVRLASLLDLGVRAADALGAEELHGIGGGICLSSSSRQPWSNPPPLASTDRGRSRVVSRTLARMAGQRGDVAKKQFGQRGDAIAVVGFGSGGIVALVGRVQSAEGAEGPLEAVQDEQRAGLMEHLQERLQ